jgi:peptide/nickel transport system permease protein
MWLFLAASAPMLTRHDPAEQHLEMRLSGPLEDYPLGTDHLGRSLWSRLVFGARLSLGVAVGVALASIAIGVLVGLCSGYFGGIIDTVLMRITDLMLALPRLVLALAIAGTLGPSITNLALALVIVSWAGFARVFRSQVLSLREREYVLASRSIGAKNRWIVCKHVLPQLLSTILVMATVDFGSLVLSISGLSFLGLGAQPPTPEWGTMLNDAQIYFTSAPQLAIIPGLAIVSVGLASNLLGDSLVHRLGNGQRWGS